MGPVPNPFKEMFMKKRIKRERRFELTFNEVEWNKLVSDYQKSGLINLTEYIRACLNDSKVKRVYGPRKTTDEKLIGQIKRVGNNVNQIARKLNSGEYGNQTDELNYRLQLALMNLEKCVCDVQAHQQKEEE